MGGALKRLALIAALVPLVFCACGQPGLIRMWASVRRAQVAPFTEGRCFFVDQDVYGLLSPDGAIVWQHEVEGANRVSVQRIGDAMFALGDNHQISRFSEDGATIWTFKAPTGSSCWLLASNGDTLAIALDTDSTYPLNPIFLVGLSLETGEEKWTLRDRDYQRALGMPEASFEANTLVVPFSKGDSVWLDGISVQNGSFAWRAFWGNPRPGHPMVLAQNPEKIWIWRAKGDGVEAAVLNRATGKITGMTSGPATPLVDTTFTGNAVYAAFKDSRYVIDGNGVYKKFDSTWLPLCSLPGYRSKVVAISKDCQKIGILDLTDLTVADSFDITVCYTAKSGLSPGEFYLVPEVAPYDHASFRYIYDGGKMGELKALPDTLRRLGRDKTLFDLQRQIEQMKR